MRLKLSLILFLTGYISFAQDAEKKVEISPDFHFRTFWMSTTYPSDFKDDFALGSSLNLGTKIKINDPWTIQLGYRVFANLWSSAIAEPDPLTGQSNRYETGLFDLLNPEDRFFGKFELLNLKYTKDKWGVQLGRFGINTPWINAQDGRLSPTGIEGGHLWVSLPEKWKIDLLGIRQISVRGTSEWLGVGESIGVFPSGRGVDGQKSSYSGETNSDFIGIIEISKETKDFGKWYLSQTLVQNVSTTFWFSWDKNLVNQSTTEVWIAGFQAGFQQGIGEGGNEEISFRYKNPNDRNGVISARFGYKNKGWLTHLNYSKLWGNGRWLHPREWGKDPWYTFIPRERNEGFESLDALTYLVSYSFPEAPVEVYGHFGFHWLPSVDDAAANKYAIPGYRQINVGVKYRPDKLEKSSLHLLLMNKEALGNPFLSPSQRYNKLEMIHINLIFDWYLN